MTTKNSTSRIIPIITVEMYCALLRKGKAPRGYNYLHLLTLTSFGQEQPVRGIWVEPLTEIETTVGTYLVANWTVESCWDLSTALYGQGIDTDFLDEDFHILPHSQLCDAPVAAIEATQAPVEITTQGEITESDVNFTDGEWDITPTPDGSDEPTDSGTPAPVTHTTLKSAVALHFNADKATKSEHAYYLAFWRKLAKSNSCTLEICGQMVTITRLEKGDFAVSAQSQPVAPVVITAEDKPQPTIKRTNPIKHAKKRVVISKLPNLIGEIMSPRDFASMIGMPIYKVHISVAPQPEMPAPAPVKKLSINRTPSLKTLTGCACVGWNADSLNDDDLAKALMYNLAAQTLAFTIIGNDFTSKLRHGQLQTLHQAASKDLEIHILREYNKRGLADQYEFDVNMLPKTICSEQKKEPAPAPIDWHTIIDEITDCDLIDSREWADHISESETKFDAMMETERAEMQCDDYDAEQGIERKNSPPVPSFELLATKAPVKPKKATRAKFVQMTGMLFDTPKVSTADLIARRAAQRKQLGDRLPPAPLFRGI